MKICEKCGAKNSDIRKFCIDCNERLGDKLSNLEEHKFHQNISEQIEKAYNKKDPLYVSKFDKIIGAISFIGVAFTVVLIVINLITQQSIQYLWLGIIFFLLSALEAFIPKISWELEKIRLSWYMNGADDAEPSDFYLYSRKFTIVILAIVGISILVTNFIL